MKKIYKNLNPKSDRGYFRNVILTMRYNLLWFIPLFIWVILYFVVQNVITGYDNLTIIYKRFNMGMLISPSVYLYFGLLITSVFLPIQLMMLMPVPFEKSNPYYRRKYIISIVVVVLIFISSVIIQLIMWGSFPVIVDNKGYIHIRMIPFLPWPETPFM